MRTRTEIRLLGTPDILHRGVSITPSARKPRQVLGLLALRAGKPVNASLLLEEIWGDEPPRSATTTLQTYILQIRRLIARAAGNPKDLLQSCDGGYMLTDDCWLDTAEFDQLSLRGAAAWADGDARTASALLTRALALWRGPALSGIPIGRVLEPELIWLEEARLRAIEQRIEADLRLGKYLSLVPELHRLVLLYPMNENLAGQLMRAHASCGQVNRALDVFRRLRQEMISELGIEPSDRLQRLQRAVLTGDSALNDGAYAFID
jgi:SARP family transcriptional regulator, regulator of embCAB operon